MIRRHAFIAATTVMVALTMTFGVVAATAGGKDDGDTRPSGLVGTWDVTLSLPGQPPGRVLATFNRGGTTTESAAAPPSSRGASHGVWKRIGRDLFAVTRVFFRFDPQTGAYLGTTKVNATVRLAPDGKTFAAVSRSELRDPTGTVLATGLPGTARAVRMSVETIADRP